MDRVVIESPLSPSNGYSFADNVRYARLCMLDSLHRGEAPFVSHLLYTQVWDDDDEMQRLKGISAGHVWYGGADFGAAYTDLGQSKGMLAGCKAAARYGKRVTFRRLPADLMALFEAGVESKGTEGAV